jgi:hypothetical protein
MLLQAYVFLTEESALFLDTNRPTFASIVRDGEELLK